MKVQTKIKDVIYNDIEDILDETPIEQPTEQPFYYNENRREIINDEIDVLDECPFNPFNCGGER